MSNKKWQRNAVVLLFLISQLTLVSSQLPLKIDALLPEVNSIYPDTGVVNLKWNKPEVEIGGGPIQSYTIKFYKPTIDTFITDTFEDSSELVEYSKPISEIGVVSVIEIQVKANNADGEGDYSDVYAYSPPFRELPIPLPEIITDTVIISA
jgi:hypothetical protein